MIVVKIELHSAISGKVSELGRMHISNDGTGSRTRGNYTIKTLRKKTGSLLRSAKVNGHPRLSQPVWVLLSKALAALGYDARLPLLDGVVREAASHSERQKKVLDAIVQIAGAYRLGKENAEPALDSIVNLISLNEEASFDACAYVSTEDGVPD